MKSDITRSTFDHKKHYSGVRMQQGRVQLDADWNEQIDIVNHRSEIGTLDIIGACGAPENHDGFELIEENDKPKIKAGRFYVDGMLCTNEADVLFEAQPDLPGISLPDAPGFYIAYLDVWQRSITAIEDPNLREVALGVADTATRTQTVWQVKLAGPNALYGNHNDCEKNFENWARPLRTRRARMLAQVVPVESELGEAGATASNTGFRGVQNHLYRVEIHEPAIRGGGGTDSRLATFKWSRDNGSFLRAIKTIEGDVINLLDPGRDDLQRFQPGQWIEVSNDPQELGEAGAGVLVRIKSVTAGVALQIEPETATGALPASLPSDQAARERWKVRRWDQKAEAPVTSVSANEWLPLEDGLEVKFGAGDIYHPGDYWLIPTRAVTGGTIDWPIDENTKAPLPQSRFGIHHHYCPLAILNNSGGAWTVEHDCRRIFSSLTEQLNFFYVGGDGQEALPGKALPRPLQVGVTNNARPVAGAKVKFSIIAGSGKLFEEENDKHDVELTVSTGQREDGEFFGIAQCFYELDNTNQVQQIKAALLDGEGNDKSIAIRFNLNLSRAPEVEYKVIDCSANVPPDPPPTMQSLLQDQVAGWPERDEKGNTTLKYILDTLLCKLDADKLPFQHRCASELYPPNMESVGQALKALCDLAAQHVSYEVPLCGNQRGEPPTVQSLFENILQTDWPPQDLNGRTTVKLIFDALLCKLHAAMLPFLHQRGGGLFPNTLEQTVSAALDYLSRRSVPAGTVMAFINRTPPVGWLECNGQAITQSEFPDLYRALTGSDTDTGPVNLPDLRGEFVRGWISNRPIANIPGETSGRQIGEWQSDTLQVHTHQDSGHNHIDSGHSHTVIESPHSHQAPTFNGGGGNFEVAPDNKTAFDYNFAAPTSEAVTDITIAPAQAQIRPAQASLAEPVAFAEGGIPRLGKETRPRNVALMYCVKT